MLINLYQSKTAEMIGVNESTIRRIEDGEALPPKEKIEDFARVYQVDLEILKSKIKLTKQARENISGARKTVKRKINPDW